MPKVYIISDCHFGHFNIINLADRPFKDISGMAEAIIRNWNEAVLSEDIVYFLGDFAMGRHGLESDTEIFNRLNGHKKMILGNHDRHFNAYQGDSKVFKIKGNDLAIDYWRTVGFEEVFAQPIVLDNYFILSHEPINGLMKGQIFANIHGHTHNVSMTGGNYFNASVEVNNYRPVDFEYIKESFIK